MTSQKCGLRKRRIAERDLVMASEEVRRNHNGEIVPVEILQAAMLMDDDVISKILGGQLPYSSLGAWWIGSGLMGRRQIRYEGDVGEVESYI